MNDIAVIHLRGHGGFAIVDTEDFGWLNQFVWSKDFHGYPCRYIRKSGKTVRIPMHRVINDTPPGFETDHINGCRHDNTRRNLRTATEVTNQQNRRKQRTSSTSRFKGVTWFQAARMWRATIGIRGHGKHLGYFSDEIQAAIAYNRAAREHFGDFALLNLVDESQWMPDSRHIWKKDWNDRRGPDGRLLPRSK